VKNLKWDWLGYRYKSGEPNQGKISVFSIDWFCFSLLCYTCFLFKLFTFLVKIFLCTTTSPLVLVLSYSRSYIWYQSGVKKWQQTFYLHN